MSYAELQRRHPLWLDGYFLTEPLGRYQIRELPDGDFEVRMTNRFNLTYGNGRRVRGHRFPLWWASASYIRAEWRYGQRPRLTRR